MCSRDLKFEYPTDTALYDATEGNVTIQDNDAGVAGSYFQTRPQIRTYASVHETPLPPVPDMAYNCDESAEIYELATFPEVHSGNNYNCIKINNYYMTLHSM